MFILLCWNILKYQCEQLDNRLQVQQLLNLLDLILRKLCVCVNLIYCCLATDYKLNAPFNCLPLKCSKFYTQLTKLLWAKFVDLIKLSNQGEDFSSDKTFGTSGNPESSLPSISQAFAGWKKPAPNINSQMMHIWIILLSWMKFLSHLPIL